MCAAALRRNVRSDPFPLGNNDRERSRERRRSAGSSPCRSVGQPIPEHPLREIAGRRLAIPHDHDLARSSQRHGPFTNGRQQAPPGLTVDDTSGLAGTDRRASLPAPEQGTNGRVDAGLEIGRRGIEPPRPAALAEGHLGILHALAGLASFARIRGRSDSPPGGHQLIDELLSDGRGHPRIAASPLPSIDLEKCVSRGLSRPTDCRAASLVPQSSRLVSDGGRCVRFRLHVPTVSNRLARLAPQRLASALHGQGPGGTDMTAAEIQPGMPVVCGTDANAQFATVDHMEGNDIKLKRDDAGNHHYIPLSWAKRAVDGKIQVDRRRRTSWRSGARRRRRSHAAPSPATPRQRSVAARHGAPLPPLVTARAPSRPCVC